MSDIVELAKQVDKLTALAEQEPRGPSTVASTMVEVDGKMLPGIIAREIFAGRAAAAKRGPAEANGPSLDELKERWQEAHPKETLPRENKPFFVAWATGSDTG